MAKSTTLVSKSSPLMTLGLVAALLLSVYVVSDGFNLSSRAARPKYLETGRFVLVKDSDCKLGNSAIVNPSGKCVSTVADNLSVYVGKLVQAEGVYKNSVFYTNNIRILKEDLPTPKASSKPRATKIPRVVKPTPDIVIDDPRN